MTTYRTISENEESTVVAEYTPEYGSRPTAYQTEAELEQEFIGQLRKQAYEYISLHTEDELVANLRVQLERLNNIKFTDSEWGHFFKSRIANQSYSIAEKTAIIQEDHIQLLEREDGTTKNIYLLDKEHIHNNHLQVINQYSADKGTHDNRYDVSILVNGLPLVHIELKRRGVDLKEAFNQINRYQRESFWAGSGLFEYVQVFVISNGTYTKYYSNTTRQTHIRENSSSNIRKGSRTSNSYEFTSWWADANNKPITDLRDFAKTFFAKHTLLNILTKYCVFTAEKLLLVMRPYQIVATERILSTINVANNYRKYGTIQGGGYIWHTTGSGKTLTSFKTAQLATQLPYIDKVLFVVDRNDLDYQTILEYDKFKKGAANSNTSTAILKKQLENDNIRIIITTIQKMAVFIKKYPDHPVFDKHLVIIFDECHRSQFGEMHTAIVRHFRKYHLFGFTGTPIFADNASAGGNPRFKTTAQAFGGLPDEEGRPVRPLHSYTIVDAITDRNVLPFRVDYVSTMREEENIQDAKVWNIDREKALLAPERISNIVRYILRHFDSKTYRNRHYKVKDRRLAGFNSIFAVASIDAAKLYYTEFQRQMADLPSDKRLKIATIFSFGINEEMEGVLSEEDTENTDRLDASSREFLDSAIQDYNRMFRTNYDTSSRQFENYYKDVSDKVRKREIDLLIVVNMFLTGFDATTLNTLWVDKNLRLHGLLQAYSRTNRILNSIKTFGNIVCFRNLEKATNDSIALFSNKNAGGIILLRPFRDYYEGYNDGTRDFPGYKDLIAELLGKYPLGQHIVGEQAEKAFIRLYGAILRLRNILSAFDDFDGMEILSARDVQDYHSIYLDLYNKYRNKDKKDQEDVNDDIVFEMELIKQIEINIDYILMLLQKYKDSRFKDKEIIVTINKSIDSSMEMRSKKDLIQQFIADLTPDSRIDEDWQKFITQKKHEELEEIIREERLDRNAAYGFVNNAFRDGYMPEYGRELAGVLPPMSRFAKDGQREKKKETVLEKLKAFFTRFKDLASGMMKM